MLVMLIRKDQISGSLWRKEEAETKSEPSEGTYRGAREAEPAGERQAVLWLPERSKASWLTWAEFTCPLWGCCSNGKRWTSTNFSRQASPTAYRWGRKLCITGRQLERLCTTLIGRYEHEQLPANTHSCGHWGPNSKMSTNSSYKAGRATFIPSLEIS